MRSSAAYHTPDQTTYFQNKAQQHNLAMTCGSDFHGKTKPAIAQGSVTCDVPEAQLLASLAHQRK